MVVCAETSRRRRRRRLTTMQPQHAYCYGSEHHPDPPHHRDPPPMVLHRDMLHQDLPPHRDPPPYPGQFRPLYQPGYRQSYSGSETSTDLSLSSTENLSTFTRQDPQGEETTAGVTTPSMDPWDNLLGEVSYSQLPQLSHLAAVTSGVEVKATNSGTFYVTGSRPTSASPNQELLYWSGDGQLQSGGFYGTNMLPARTVLAQQGCYPQPVCVAASGKMQLSASGMRPRSAHGAPGGRRQEPLHMVPRPASVNASPIPGIYALEGSPPPLPISILPNVTSRSKPVRSTATASVAVTAASTTAAIAPIMTAPAAVMPGGGSSGGQTMPMSFPPPPQYPGPGGTMAAPSSSPATRVCLDMTSSSGGGGVNANGIMMMPTANVARKIESQQQRPTTKAMSSSSSSSSTTSPTGSTDSSPTVSGAESPLVRGTNSGPTTGAAAATLPYPGPVLHPPTNTNKTSSPVKNNYCHSYEVGESTQRRTTSHPDILCHNDTTAPGQLSLPPANKATGQRTPSPQPTSIKQQGQQNGIRKGELDHATIAARATKMVERLSQENRQLRQELEGYCRKVTKLQKFEIEIQKVHDSYESLVKQSQRRESLEKIMRFKLEAEVRKLTETNKELKDQLNKALSQLEQKQVYDLSDSELKKEIHKKDSTISKLISQNKELNAAKERLEIEIAAQRSTLQEQRAHIDVLNTAIVNAQSQSLRLEEEAVRKAAQDDVVTELQRAVAGLQMASDKKDSLHQRLLAKLEEEITNLQGRRLQSSLGSSRTSDTDEGISSDSEPSVSVQTLIQQLRKKEQRILQLEVNVVKLEERYLEEHALRQLAVDAASFPKDARIAALEQNSSDTGKIIAEAKSDRLKHLEELYQANRKVAEIEAKVKTCQAQLAEKDAMIAVMQKHNSLSRASSLSSLLYSPLHSPHPSLASSLTSSLTSSSLTSSLTSSAMSMSSSSAPVSSPPSASSSRQSSQIDTSLYREARPGLHNKSNSTGSAGVTNNTGSPNSEKKQEAQIKELKQRLAAQAKLFQTLQLGPDQLSKCLWQV